jgi:hypothetical protein
MEDASSWSLLQIHKDDRRIVGDDTIIALAVAPGRVAVGGVMRHLNGWLDCRDYSMDTMPWQSQGIVPCENVK